MSKEQQEMGLLRGPHISTSAPTTTINIPAEISRPDHVVWSTFNALFLNFCCLGFIAYAYSVKVLYGDLKLDLFRWDRKMVGDVTGAQAYASTAKCLNICALVFSIIMIIIFIALYVSGLGSGAF